MPNNTRFVADAANSDAVRKVFPSAIQGHYFDPTPSGYKSCGCCWSVGLSGAYEWTIQGKYSRNQLKKLIGSEAWVRGVKYDV